MVDKNDESVELEKRDFGISEVIKRGFQELVNIVDSSGRFKFVVDFVKMLDPSSIGATAFKTFFAFLGF